jgi:hypothetical protein
MYTTARASMAPHLDFEYNVDIDVDKQCERRSTAWSVAENGEFCKLALGDCLSSDYSITRDIYRKFVQYDCISKPCLASLNVQVVYLNRQRVQGSCTSHGFPQLSRVSELAWQ